MTGMDEFQNLCKKKVLEYYNNRVEKTDNNKIGIYDVYVVWSCRVLQNYKALLSTTVSDGMYYELTFSGDKNRLYFDAYKKWENICYDITD